jgi:hypothetical protein
MQLWPTTVSLNICFILRSEEKQSLIPVTCHEMFHSPFRREAVTVIPVTCHKMFHSPFGREAVTVIPVTCHKMFSLSVRKRSH